MENNQLAVSLNIVLTPEVIETLTQLQQLLATNFVDQRTYDYSPHLAICTKFMTREEVDGYKFALKEYFNNGKAFEIRFARFDPTPTRNYIFLNFDDATREYILELNADIKEITKGVGEETLGGLPPKYPFDPHISIIKLAPSQVDAAMGMLEGKFQLNSMSVTQLELTVQSENSDGKMIFPRELLLELR